MSYSSFPLLLQGKSTYKVTMLYLPNTLGFFSKYVHKYSYHFIVAMYLRSREGRHHSPWWVHEGTEAQEGGDLIPHKAAPNYYLYVLQQQGAWVNEG